MAYKILTAEFIKSAAQPKQFLSPEVPEIAFAGRSNVGKSSLLNVLVNRKGIAKTSKTPGKTRLVNFFDVRLESHHIRLVDLPGYGYAKVKGEMRKEWSSLIEQYIANRPNLRLVCSLVDCRHNASPLDAQLLEWLRHCQVPHLIVLTKSDKLSRSALERNRKTLQTEFGLDAGILMIPFSALNRSGRDELWKAIVGRL